MSSTDQQRRPPDGAATHAPPPGTSPIPPAPAPPAPTSTANDPGAARPAARPDRAAATGVRASDDEREATVSRLHRAVGEGRLGLSEADDRVALAYAATYRHELPALLTDLPRPARGPRPAGSEAPSWSQVWSSVVWRARVTLLGRDGPAAAAPSAAQCRVAGLLVVLAGLWLLLCAFLGAGALG